MTAEKVFIVPIYAAGAAIAGYALGYALMGSHGIVAVICACAAAYGGAQLALSQIRGLVSLEGGSLGCSKPPETLRTVMKRLRKIAEYQDLPNQLKEYAEPLIYETRAEIEKLIDDGEDPIPGVIACVLLAARVRLGSGEMHTYRGLLSMRGKRWLERARELLAYVERDFPKDNPGVLLAKANFEAMVREIKAVG
jgi:hypothetical protein